MIKRMVLMLCLVGLVFGGLYAFQRFKASMIKKAVAGLSNPSQTVATTKATTTAWQHTLQGVGTFRAFNGADLAIEVGGVVSDIRFSSGETVKAGQMLLQLRVDDELGKLEQLQATANLDAINLRRDQDQFKFKAVSQATIDSDAATLQSALAQVAQEKAIIAEKTLTAPFAGRLGIRQVDLGQYLSVGTTIVTLQALDPIYIDFYLPQQALSQVHVGQSVRVSVDTYPGAIFPGTISASNSKVDNSSRNIQVRATLTNTDLKLVPGMYAVVEIDDGAPQQLVTLPQSAIIRNSYGETVYIVDKKSDGPEFAARQVFVKTSDRRGDQVALSNGVKDGETVVVAGQLKLHNGSVVTVDNSVRPTDDPAPAVGDD